jgi:hypothetical protein
MAKLIAMTQPSVLYQLVDARLDGKLVEYVAEHKAAMSWRAMAADLSQRAGVQVNYETLRLWFADRIETTVVVKDRAGAA